MKPVVTVGSRELKTRLGRYLNRVRQGDTILVTDRDELVAELRPIGNPDDRAGTALKAMAARGALTLPTRASVTAFVPARVAASAAAAVSSDRDERG
jgi:antitoxin (DNA-binding transcriptional repressor) of toxin-antitoxin stability system